MDRRPLSGRECFTQSSNVGTFQSSLEGSRRLLHELEVHQLELKAQNEELRQTQLQLEEARSRYCDLYEWAPIAYFTLSQAGLIQDANLTAAALLRVAKHDLLQQPLTRFILTSDQDVYSHHRKQLLETCVRQVSELRVLTGAAEPCWMRLEETVARDAGGELASRAVLSDINAHKRAEETLKTSEERHRILFEKSRDALMTLSPPDWRFTSANSTTLALFGASSEQDFVSRSLGAYSPVLQPDGDASAQASTTMVESAMRDGSHYREWTFKRLRGSEFSATVLLTRIEIDSRPLLQATVRDETEMKSLQAMVSQRDRLASMGMLAASVAHEINNPLTNVIYNIEALANDLPKLAVAIQRCVRAPHLTHPTGAPSALLGDEVRVVEPSTLNDLVERAREAFGSAQRIKTITRAIGTFARVESTELSQVDLNYAIKCATTLAVNEIKFRAKLILELGEIPPVLASEGKLSQVFLNLLINAAHAIGDGDVQTHRIRVRTGLEGKDVYAEVEDTGRGIAHEHLKRVFEPFFTTKAVGVGSGLGLAICRNILEEFGGDIRVESNPGGGARFVVRLPIRAVASVAPSRNQAAAKLGTDTRPGGRILVVDDEEAIRTIIRRLLERQHVIVTAESGRAAQAILEDNPSFDVIICDLMMPEMTGMELHRWLAEHRPVLADRVVFVSGGAFTYKAAEYLARVPNPRLEKPFDSASLEQIVAAMCARSSTPHLISSLSA